MQVYFAVVVNILLLFCPHPSHCQQPVNCRWGPYGAWSDCDACTGTKVRTRAVEAFAQYGGTACRSEESQVVQCDSHSTCLRQHNCGGRFRCSPSTPSPGLEGQCISMSLVCNGDQDCEDSSDERDCVLGGDHHRVCDTDKTPPNSDLTGRGYDVLTGKLKEGVINTLSFGGQCRKVFSGAHGLLYRLPQSLLRYSFEVHVDSEKSDESYESSWSYMLHLEEDAMYEHHRRTFHEELSESKAQRILILKNQVALARFQNTAPQYLTLSQGFWSSLSSLPLAYDYPVYRRLLQTYGTHYMSEGTLGGQYQALLEFDRHSLESTSTTDTEYQRCWRKVKRRLFRKKVKTVCEKLTTALKSSDGRNSNVLRVKTNVVGGAVGSIAGLGVLDLEHPEANADAYERWASSVSDFPNVIDQKLRPLYELVKEVRCAGLKRRHLELATERYLAEQHPCHCQPCRNNGRPLLSDNQCVCLCRPGTRGPACKQGSVAGEPAGVIHGGWSCWSAWSPCSGGQRSRTRLCNNPSPEGGGVHCSGEGLGRKPCEDPDIEYLKTMEPQCFGLAVPPPLTCGLPPNLPNGLIRSPKDFYAVGSRVQYQCIHGHYLVGETEAQCTASQTWTTAPKHCRKMSCDAPPVRGNVLATPSRDSYEIGDRVSLSCPQGWRLEAEEPVILCSPSLQWSPFRADAVRCSLVPLAPTPRADLDCKLWERPGALGCVCRMAFECLPSLPLCTELGAGRTRLLSACQVGAMRCLGRAMSLANDSECVWPASNTASCPACTPGQICHEGQCVCQNPEACPDDSTGLCVRPADANVAVTMTQCEVGARRCAGSQVTVISIDECPETG